MEKITGCSMSDLGDAELHCSRKDGRCGYHCPAGTFSQENLLPKGLCPSAYHALYSHSLAILFEGDPGRVPETVFCPGVSPCVTFRRVFHPVGLRHRLLNLVKLLVRPIMRGQVYTSTLCWEVAEVSGECPAGHVSGQVFIVDKGGLHVTRTLVLPMGDERTACPALFHNFFTYRPLALLGQGPASRGGQSPRYVCPDHLVNITLEGEQ